MHFSPSLTVASALHAFVLTGLTLPADAQSCYVSQYLSDNNYTPDADGSWWVRRNWIDNDADGNIDWNTDTYLFSDSSASCSRIPLADPSIYRLTVNGKPMWFITGTLGFDTNVYIYRTTDFRTFALHMKAFNEDATLYAKQYVVKNGQGVPQHLHLETSGGLTRRFVHLWAPQLYRDPLAPLQDDSNIFLTFSAQRYPLDSQGNLPTGITEHSDGWRSIWQARIQKRGLLAWLELDPQEDDGPRFLDQREWFEGDEEPVFQGDPFGFHYLVNNSTGTGGWRFDGGIAEDSRIPSSIMYEEWDQGGTGQPGEHWVSGAFHAHHGDGMPGGSIDLLFPTALFNDPYIFFDPTIAEPHAWMAYNWRVGTTAFAGRDRGFFIGTFAMFDNLRFDCEGSLVYLAANQNSVNPIVVGDDCGADDNIANNGTTTNHFTNGVPDGQPPVEACNLNVAEQPVIFYNTVNERYYVLYNRNSFQAATYQICYRMTEPEAPLSSLDLATELQGGINEHPWDPDMDTLDNGSVISVDERVLLKASDYSSGSASYGVGDVFSINVGGTEHYYLLFHVKSDGTSHRTPFLKELYFNTDGTIKALSDLVAADPDINIFMFRWPANPEELCPADLSASQVSTDPTYGVPDGVVDTSDLYYFLDQFNEGNYDVADLTTTSDPQDPGYGIPDHVIDAQDYFYYLDIYGEPCPA